MHYERVSSIMLTFVYIAIPKWESPLESEVCQAGKSTLNIAWYVCINSVNELLFSPHIKLAITVKYQTRESVFSCHCIFNYTRFLLRIIYPKYPCSVGSFVSGTHGWDTSELVKQL